MPDKLFTPPYYAVIFTATRTNADPEGYEKTADLMSELAASMPGYLGVESTRDPETGLGITVSYWRDLDSIAAWKKQTDHTAARNQGRAAWYRDYALRVARVEREYDFKALE